MERGSKCFVIVCVLSCLPPALCTLISIIVVTLSLLSLGIGQLPFYAILFFFPFSLEQKVMVFRDALLTRGARSK